MNPIDVDGNVVVSNVFIAGRNLRGYDFCFEKSGNSATYVEVIEQRRQQGRRNE